METGKNGKFREWWRKNLPGWTLKRKRDRLLLVGTLLVAPGYLQRIGIPSFGSFWLDLTVTLSFLFGCSLLIATLVVYGIHDLVLQKSVWKGVMGILGGVLLAAIINGPALLLDKVFSSLDDDPSYSTSIEIIEKKLERKDLTANKRSVLSRNRAHFIFWRDGSLEPYQTPEGKTVLFTPSDDDWKHRSTMGETRQMWIWMHGAAIFSMWYFSLLLLASAGAGTAVCLRQTRKKKAEELPPAIS